MKRQKLELRGKVPERRKLKESKLEVLLQYALEVSASQVHKVRLQETPQKQQLGDKKSWAEILVATLGTEETEKAIQYQ